jgi:hypothetical protein
MANSKTASSRNSAQAEERTGEAPADKLVLGRSNGGPQRRTGRRSDWTQEKADKFVEVLAESCNVLLAARAIRRSVGNVYRQRCRDASFRAAWDQALCIGYSRLELMMLERALFGTEKAVTLKSGESRILREYNDRVALALLRHHRGSVAAIEAGVEEQDYQEACERIIDKLGRLREREEAAGGSDAPADGVPSA